MKFSCAILHKPTPERSGAIMQMIDALDIEKSREEISIEGHIFIDPKPEGMDWQEFKTILAVRQWEWSLNTQAEQCVFLTDDLNIHPQFWEVLKAMVEGMDAPHGPIGLLSNHPRAPELYRKGHIAYRTNSWLVGPAYMLPRYFLKRFLQWYKGLPDDDDRGHRRWFNDDSAINEFVTQSSLSTWHPIPTIIEHRADLPSTVGHGDRYSRERVSWREIRHVVEDSTNEGSFNWESTTAHFVGERLDTHMRDPSYWNMTAPLLPVGE